MHMFNWFDGDLLYVGPSNLLNILYHLCFPARHDGPGNGDKRPGFWCVHRAAWKSGWIGPQQSKLYIIVSRMNTNEIKPASMQYSFDLYGFTYSGNQILAFMFILLRYDNVSIGGKPGFFGKNHSASRGLKPLPFEPEKAVWVNLEQFFNPLTFTLQWN